MDEWTKKHLQNWLEQKFPDEAEQARVKKLIEAQYNSDPEYYITHNDWTWWDVLKHCGMC